MRVSDVSLKMIEMLKCQEMIIKNQSHKNEGRIIRLVISGAESLFYST
jgi:hypothetical protein